MKIKKKENDDYILKNSMSVSFEIGHQNGSAEVCLAFTNYPEDLWLNENWANEIKNNMKTFSSKYSTVLLFDQQKNMPDVSKTGMNYSSDYDKYMVCVYWVYPNGSEKYCYGGVRVDEKFRKSIE